ncbi:CocE/NonD family hydrolase [Gordonia humi]|uniref:CocE/NonD family hydrolase n=1 Tax=Gordonia humi TaxID=686429 RepID=UPI00361FA882
MLCYSSPPLSGPLEVTGYLRLILYVSSSAFDTDFTGKLVDVDTDGRPLYLSDGILRMRYRSSLSSPELMTPGDVYEVSLDLGVTSNVFFFVVTKSGWKCRVAISLATIVILIPAA